MWQIVYKKYKIWKKIKKYVANNNNSDYNWNIKVTKSNYIVNKSHVKEVRYEGQT